MVGVLDIAANNVTQQQQGLLAPEMVQYVHSYPRWVFALPDGDLAYDHLYCSGDNGCTHMYTIRVPHMHELYPG